MELPSTDSSRAGILRAAQIQILAPQKTAKDCLIDAGFSPILTTSKAFLMRFKRVRNKLVDDSSENASKVARLGVPGMVAVGGSSCAESLLTSPSFAGSSRNCLLSPKV
jgi:hypothetical protein